MHPLRRSAIVSLGAALKWGGWGWGGGWGGGLAGISQVFLLAQVLRHHCFPMVGRKHTDIKHAKQEQWGE